MGRRIDDGADDPKGLIREAYRIDGITEVECRSILLDWALSVPGDARDALTSLLLRYDHIDHPMTALLRQGISAQPARRRSRPRARLPQGDRPGPALSRANGSDQAEQDG